MTHHYNFMKISPVNLFYFQVWSALLDSLCSTTSVMTLARSIFTKPKSSSRKLIERQAMTQHLPIPRQPTPQCLPIVMYVSSAMCCVQDVTDQTATIVYRAWQVLSSSTRRVSTPPCSLSRSCSLSSWPWSLSSCALYQSSYSWRYSSLCRSVTAAYLVIFVMAQRNQNMWTFPKTNTMGCASSPQTKVCWNLSRTRRMSLMQILRVIWTAVVWRQWCLDGQVHASRQGQDGLMPRSYCMMLK